MGGAVSFECTACDYEHPCVLVGRGKIEGVCLVPAVNKEGEIIRVNILDENALKDVAYVLYRGNSTFDWPDSVPFRSHLDCPKCGALLKERPDKYGVMWD